MIEAEKIGSYVAIGDSFTEGLGDPWPDGTPRGWADRLAEGLSEQYANGEFRYANLAIRGRKLEPMVAEQLERALEMQPDLISFNGGGNDIMRPRFRLEALEKATKQAIERIHKRGVHLLLLTGPNPSGHLPAGRIFEKRGTQLVADTVTWVKGAAGITYCDNYSDQRFRALSYWSPDGLHLSSAGHLQVATNALTALGVPVPENWVVEDLLDDEDRKFGSWDYYRQHVGPWVKRRLKGQSSGDGRTAKIPQLIDWPNRTFGQ